MHVKFSELPVHNQDRAIAFYTEHMNMVVDKDESYGGDWRWVELAMNGGQTNILMAKSIATERPNSPTVVFVVENINSLHAKLSEAGIEVKQAPRKSPWKPDEISMSFYDSEENLILVTSPSEAIA